MPSTDLLMETDLITLRCIYASSVSRASTRRSDFPLSDQLAPPVLCRFGFFSTFRQAFGRRLFHLPLLLLAQTIGVFFKP